MALGVRVSCQVISRIDEVPSGEWLPKFAALRPSDESRDTSNPLLLHGISAARPEGLEPPTF
jgi:hypothetical protein